jgi:hypothetical protein
VVEQLEEAEGGHVLSGGRLEVMRWQCRFMQPTSTLTDFNQRRQITVKCALGRLLRRQG